MTIKNGSRLETAAPTNSSQSGSKLNLVSASADTPTPITTVDYTRTIEEIKGVVPQADKLPAATNTGESACSHTPETIPEAERQSTVPLRENEPTEPPGGDGVAGAGIPPKLDDPIKERQRRFRRIVNAESLANELEPLGRALPKSKSSIKETQCMRFIRTRNDTGDAYIFGDDVFALTDGESLRTQGATNFQQFLDTLRKYGNTKVTIDWGGDAVTVKNGRSTTTIPYGERSLFSFETLPPPKPDAWKVLPASFADAVKACESVVKVHKDDEVVSSINVTQTCLEAAHPSQIIRHNCDLDIPGRFLVRAGALGDLLDAKPEKYQLVGKWFYLKSAVTTFAIPVYKDAFVDNVDSFFTPGESKVVFPKELLEEISRLKGVLGKNDDVTVSIEGGKCTLIANGNVGTHTAVVDMASAEHFSFKISPYFLERVIMESPECAVDEKGIRFFSDTYSYAAAREQPVANTSMQRFGSKQVALRFAEAETTLKNAMRHFGDFARRRYVYRDERVFYFQAVPILRALGHPMPENLDDDELQRNFVTPFLDKMGIHQVEFGDGQFDGDPDGDIDDDALFISEADVISLVNSRAFPFFSENPFSAVEFLRKEFMNL